MATIQKPEPMVPIPIKRTMLPVEPDPMDEFDEELEDLEDDEELEDDEDEIDDDEDEDNEDMELSEVTSNPTQISARQTKKLTHTKKVKPITTDTEEKYKELTSLNVKQILGAVNPKFSKAVEWFNNTPQRKTMMVYVYRVLPVIIRKRGEGYIDCITEPFTEEYLIRTHGGGQYKFYFNDTSQPQGKIKLFETGITLDMNEYPPKLALEELDLTDKRNTAFINKLKSEGVLAMDGTPKPQQNNGGNVEITNKLLDVVISNQRQQNNQPKGISIDEHAAMKAIDMVADVAKRNSSESSPDKMLGMIKTIMEMNKPSNDNSMMPLILQMMKDSQEQSRQMFQLQLEAIKAQNNSNKSEPVDPMAEVDRLLSIADKLGLKPRNNPVEPKSTLEVALDHIAPIASGVMNVIAARMGLPQEQMIQTAELQQQQQQPTTMGVPTDMPNNDPNQQLVQMHQMLNQYGSIILSHMDSTPGHEKTGDMLAENVIAMAGMPVYNGIAQAGQELLYEAMKTHTPFWRDASLHGEPYVRKFVDDFINYPEIIKQEELQEGEES